MKKLLIFFAAYCLLPIAYCQPYWQQQVNYTIDVTLNDAEHTLSGFEKIEYINNSPDTLKFIWFHLWLNAYKNDKTAFTDQALENGSTDFYFSSREDKGYINRLDFKVNNITAQMEDHPQHIDIIKLILPAPLPPGQKITISTPFHVKLPFNFSRGGHDGQSYQATQWYPKPAVYDKNGWHPMTYLDQGEFYSEFGSFDVRITVPKNYVVAASGELKDPAEKDWLKMRSSFNWEPIKQKEKNSSGQIKTTYEQFPESEKTTKTLQYKQDKIHDFAWFADKRFIVNYDSCRLASGKVIDVFTYYTPQQKEDWHNTVTYAKNAIRHYSSLVGEYPYPLVQVVAGPPSFGGGMEYPTITIISPMDDKKTLDRVIAHEIGHNWFYGILASNERKHPWMDEGMNSYYDDKYSRIYYGEKGKLEQLVFETQAIEKKDQPVETPSQKFSEINYGLVAYYKTAEWMRYLESELGTETFNKGMQEYYRRWQFRHPQPEDFKITMEEVAGRNLDDAFAYLGKTGTLPNQKRTGSKLALIFDIRSLKQYAQKPTKDLFLIGPAIGANVYDKFMAGAFVTNMKLPPSRLQFLAAPLYATGSKQIKGLGFASYAFYPNSLFRKVDLGVSFSSFTADEFTGDYGQVFMGFTKIVPGFKLTLKEKDPRSTFHRFIQLKTFLINEDALRFFRDTVITMPGPDTTINTKYRIMGENRTLIQLQFVIENNRVLYPYRGELKIEQSKDFVRTAFTGKYFFNYPKEGGLDVRLFAGKFFYTSSKTFTKQFATDRYHLNMTGANGYEDYTYSDYFIGRNKFEGITSQQIMIRDGAFKVRTDLLADKVGKTDDWLIAANFGTTIPSSINPLSMLPVKIPLKFFLDIGTYAETWKQNAETDRFLFDFGLHIPLLGETVNIYIPLLYSNTYKEYIQSTTEKKQRFWKKISFSIDISNFSFRKINRNLDF
ncbi:MAG TPA: M1 family metallopeptidase [Chitinophagaceae bacterium]|nr:M1 family metallopeptidase [Chitinophagaceae bacterium]